MTKKVITPSSFPTPFPTPKGKLGKIQACAIKGKGTGNTARKASPYAGEIPLKLFHGSNLEVASPKIRPNLRALDFGAGFYLTSSESQAIRWAKTVVRRRGTGKAIVNVYTLQDEKFNELSVLKFETANGDWLDFVVRNRKEQALETSYDLVIGPVANDATLPVIDDYIDGVYTKEEAVRRLLPQNLTDQYAFLTEKALALLAFERSEAR